MSLIKRASLYIFRNKTRTILLVLILAFLMMISLNGIAIKSNVDRESENVRTEYGSSFTLQTVYVDADENYETIELDDGTTVRKYIGPQISDETINRILLIPDIENYNEGGWSGEWYCKDLELIPGLFNNLYKEQLNDETEGNRNYSKEYYLWGHSPAFYSNIEPNCDDFFENGSFELYKGQMLNKYDSNQAIISKRLADINNLDVGDHISVEIKENLIVLDGDYDKTIGNPVDFEIVGLFKTNFIYEPSYYTPESEIPENIIYISNNTAKELIETANKYQGLNNSTNHAKVKFYVNKPSALEKAIQEVKDLDCINWQYCNIETNDNNYRSLLGPLETIENYSYIMLFLSFGAGSLLVVFIFVMQLRARTKELKIYSSLGIMNKDIQKQLFYEIIITLIIAFLIMLLLSYLFSDTIAQTIISSSNEPASANTYSVVSTIWGIDIIQKSGATPNIDIKYNFIDYMIVFVVYDTVLLLITNMVSRRIIKRLFINE